MGRLLKSSVTILSAITCLDGITNASTEFNTSFDITPRTPEQLFPTNTNYLRRTASTTGQHEDNTDSIISNKNSASSQQRAPYTPDEMEKMKQERSDRIEERRKLAREKIAQLKPDPTQLEFIPEADMKDLFQSAKKVDPELEKEESQWLRHLGWGSGGNDSYESVADPGVTYDWWQQGYRMLGGFIDCDNSKDESNDNDSGDSCSRWMMWAAYVNPNYQGGGRAEYFSNSNNYYYGDGGQQQATTALDCHSPDTQWELLGVYRQEFYQFLEQISKHLWAIDDYEYVVALAGLAYMTDADCWYVGSNNYGNSVYAGVQPKSGGTFQMSLYTDSACLILDDTDMTFDDFGLTSDMYLGSKDDGCLDDDTLATLYNYWTQSQEYTLTLMNEIYDEYKYCTLCMDYPTYQDGYFIGDSGTDDDDIINQCWKFHSHDSFYCTAECIALGDAQGSIVQVQYGSNIFGSGWEGSSGSGSSTTFDHVNKGYTSNDSTTKMEKLKANAFLTFNGILFIATFLAYSVARGSRSDNKSSDKRKSLLSRDDRSRHSTGSRSRSKASASRRRSKSTTRRLPNDERSSRSKKSSSRSKSGHSQSRRKRGNSSNRQ